MSRRDGSTKADRYLAELKSEEVDSEFPTDEAAIINARRVCGTFDRTGDPKGGKVDEIGVRHFCPKWSKDFKILWTRDLEGSFTIYADEYGDEEYWSEYDEKQCEGEGGYSDINASTPVVVTNVDGSVLARTSLGKGVSYGSGTCVFKFKVTLTDGEGQYIFRVGDRGETSETFDILSQTGIDITLGN